MSGDRSVLPGYTFEGRGPAQQRLLSWLRERVPDCEFDAAVAQRSPAGSWAIKVHAPNRVSECASLLEDEPWIERVAVRPQHLYVRIGVERLCEWVSEGYAPGAPDPIAGSEGRGRSVLVRAVDVDALAAVGEERPLRLFRETAVARSVAALLRSRGFSVELELLPPAGAGHETYDDVWAAAPGSVTHTVVVGSAVPLPSEVERGDHVVHLPVGEVDVRHGPLRARNGGSLTADDVVAEVGRVVVGRLARHDGADGERAVTEAYAEGVLALLLLATPRARRVQLEEKALRREAGTYRCLLRARESDEAQNTPAADEVPRVGGDEAAESQGARDLAAELDLVATNAARAAVGLEPALIARSLRAIAGAASAADHAWRMRQPSLQRAVGTSLKLAGSESEVRVEVSAASR